MKPVTLKGETYDVSAYKAELADVFAELALPWVMQITLHSTTDAIIRQIQETLVKRPALVFNLCDGYDEAGTPGLSVVKALEAANIPFTGADSRYYETTCSKITMKELFVQARCPHCRLGSHCLIADHSAASAAASVTRFSSNPQLPALAMASA